ncbi:MAG: hypothetical protein B0W54_02075 [Cellvibrio sp. 79]|nr:MAG: hypothetical protein B0W54_02075 [Cellvibrio sp. 79]
MEARYLTQHRETFMDNVAPPPSSPASCIIKLDQFQYTFFQKSRLEVHSPEGKFLTIVANPLPDKTGDDAVYQVYCQTLLLETLFDGINESVKLPQWAINSIARVIDRIDGHLKKQLSM